MDTIMILGASHAQLPLFRTAKRMGYRTCAVSIDGNYPCFEEADLCSYTDITDPKAVLEAAEKVKPAAVVTCGFDLALRSLGTVAEALGLSGPTALSAETASNKRLMKEAFHKYGVTTAPFHVVCTENDLNAALDRMSGAVMVKAVDQNGSRGIFRCETRDEALRAYKEAMSITSKDYLLVEEYISGPLFGVEGMVQNGNPVFLLPNETEVFHGATDMPVGHTVPHGNAGIIPAVCELITEGVRALGLDNCPINADLILHDGVPYIVEMTGRAGANGLSELTGAHYGVDYYEMILRLALGEDIRPYFANPREGVRISHSIRSDHTGILRRIEDRNLDDDHILGLSMAVEPGDEIRSYRMGKDRIGQIIVSASTRPECEAALGRALSNLTIELEEADHAGIHRYTVL